MTPMRLSYTFCRYSASRCLCDMALGCLSMAIHFPMFVQIRPSARYHSSLFSIHIFSIISYCSYHPLLECIISTLYIFHHKCKRFFDSIENLLHIRKHEHAIMIQRFFIFQNITNLLLLYTFRAKFRSLDFII